MFLPVLDSGFAGILGETGAVIDAPHLLQNFDSASILAPQDVQ